MNDHALSLHDARSPSDDLPTDEATTSGEEIPFDEALASSLIMAPVLRSEREQLADFLVALADFDRNRLWEVLGHPSLHAYLVRELGLSAVSAYHRKVAAELIQRFPEVVAPLRDGRLCVTSVVELSRVLTRENVAATLPRFYRAPRRGPARAA